MKDMVKDHKGDLTDFRSEADQGSNPAVKNAASQGAQIISQHLQMAEQIRPEDQRHGIERRHEVATQSCRPNVRVIERGLPRGVTSCPCIDRLPSLNEYNRPDASPFDSRLHCAFLLVFAAPLLRAERVQDLPQPTNYVSDLAGVLSPQTVQGLNALCRQVDRQAHAQIAVVTVKSLDGEPIEDFTTALEDKWKVGAKGTDRGVILLFAIQDRKRRIETGYGLEGILPDSKVGVIGRSIVPQLQAGNYDAAISSAVVQVAQIIAADAGVDLQAAPRRGPPASRGQQISLGQLLIGGAVLLVIFFLLARFAPSGTIGFLLGMFLGGGLRRRRRRGGGGGGDGGGGFGGFGGGSSGGGGASGDW